MLELENVFFLLTGQNLFPGATFSNNETESKLKKEISGEFESNEEAEGKVQTIKSKRLFLIHMNAH